MTRLLRDFEIIKNSLDNLADAYDLTTETSPAYADAITSIDKLCKTLMRRDFLKEPHDEHRKLDK